MKCNYSVLALILIAMVAFSFVVSSATASSNLPLNAVSKSSQVTAPRGSHSVPQASGITYQVYTSTLTPISGTTDIGLHGDDVVQQISLPFPVTFYGAQYTTANISSNGNLQFNSASNDNTPFCLPHTAFLDAIYVSWDDLNTTAPFGVYTAILGSAPTRQFLIEWRAYTGTPNNPVDAELIFSENSPVITVIYGTLYHNGSTSVTGVQEGDGANNGNGYTQFSCYTGSLSPNLRLDYVPQGPPTATPTATPDPCAVGWSEGALYPITVSSAAATSFGGHVYSFGGEIGGGQTETAYGYDGVSWQAIASMPISLSYHSAVNDGSYAYIVNGTGPAYTPSNELYRYDPVANSYTALATPPIATSSQTAAYLAGKIYVIGGVDASYALTSAVQVYNIASNSWSRAADYPFAVRGANAVAANGYIYVAGGVTTTATLKTYRYDPTTDTWDDAAIADIPEGVASAAFLPNAMLDGKWLLAGMSDGTYNTLAFAWDPSNNTWGIIQPMFADRTYMAGATMGEAFYAIGGQISEQYTSDNQQYRGVPCSTTTPTATASATPTSTPGGPTDTPVPSATPGGPTNTPTPTPTDCPNPFVDVQGNVFYGAIHYLSCRHVVNGIDASHYSPAGTSTRGQFAKVVTLGFGTPFYTPSTPDFSDVPTTYFAYLYIESGFHGGVLSGFDQNTCQSAGQPYPCYLPNRAITRAQLTKLVVNAAHYPLYTPSTGQDYTDVPSTNVFYVSIETAAHKGVVNGYPDHTFRPNNNIRRDEMAQIVYKGVTTP